jgi:hypothetical protein
MVLGLKNEDWEILQNDPDNWIKIPDFNVKPRDVDFQGFKYPIVGPMDKHLSFKYPIWELVTAVRTQARNRFKSLKDLTAAEDSAMNREPKTFVDYGKPESWSLDEIFAYRYRCVFTSLELCLLTYRKDKSRCIFELAEAAANVSAMMIEKPLDIESMRAARSELGKKANQVKLVKDPKQADKAQVFECWLAWKRNPLDHFGKPKYKNNEAFANDMLKFEHLGSTQVIARWCRAWKKESPTLCAK